MTCSMRGRTQLRWPRRCRRMRTQAIQARHALAVYMGRTPDQAPEIPALTTFHLPSAVPLSVPSELLRQRPDVLAAEASLRAASAQVGVATANLFPHISLSASLGSGAFKDAALFASGSKIWSAGLALTQPIFHGGALRAERKAAIADYEASIAQYRQAVLNAFRDVADTLVALDQDADALQAANAAGRCVAAVVRGDPGAPHGWARLRTRPRWRASSAGSRHGSPRSRPPPPAWWTLQRCFRRWAMPRGQTMRAWPADKVQPRPGRSSSPALDTDKRPRWAGDCLAPVCLRRAVLAAAQAACPPAPGAGCSPGSRWHRGSCGPGRSRSAPASAGSSRGRR